MVGAQTHSSDGYKCLDYCLAYCAQYVKIFPGGSDGQESACNAGDISLIPGLGRSSGKENGYLLRYSCLENPHGHRSLAGYSPWGRKVRHGKRLTIHKS